MCETDRKIDGLISLQAAEASKIRLKVALVQTQYAHRYGWKFIKSRINSTNSFSFHHHLPAERAI